MKAVEVVEVKEYVCLSAGREVARFLFYDEAAEFMRTAFGSDWWMYDYGIVEQCYEEVLR